MGDYFFKKNISGSIIVIRMLIYTHGVLSIFKGQVYCRRRTGLGTT